MKRKSKHNNIHHLVPRSRKNEGFKTSIDQNQSELEKNFHVNWHRLFFNLHPQEQLQLWYNVNKSVLSESVREVIQDILGEQKEEFYIEEIILDTMKEIYRDRVDNILGE